MSSQDDSEGEEPQDEDDEEDDEDEAQLPGGGDDDDAKIQRKLHLFQCPSVQQSMTRLWVMLPKNGDGELEMEGYIELNLRLQKCLTQEFVLERAIDSGVGDWREDVPEGRQSMSREEFAMFQFELCSLWCGPSVSLRAYLLFLNAIFIAITDARGAHSVGLKQLEAVERLPKPFFDLLSMQGWAKAKDSEDVSEEQAFNAWYASNMSPEAEKAALLQIQRQVFQVTHDVRSIFLFQDQDGRPRDDRDALELVKAATKGLDKVARTDTQRGSLPAVRDASAHGALDVVRGPTERPWCPPNYARTPGLAQPPRETASAVTAIVASAAQRRNHSAPMRVARGLPPPREPKPEPVPVGRTFETTRAQGRGRGLIFAGKSTIAAFSAGHTPDRQQTPDATAPAALRDAPAVAASLPAPVPAPARAASASRQHREQRFASNGALSQQLSASNDAVSQQLMIDDPFMAQPTALSSALAEELAPAHRSNYPEGAPQCFEGATFSPPYKLPKSPKELYARQAAPLMANKPGNVVFAALKWQHENRLVPEPFARSLKKLPETIRPAGDAGPKVGPFQHPNEPVWFEMQHRLQAILQKQGKRAERKKKRKLRAKLLRGRTRSQQRPNEARELRGYFDRHAAEMAQGPPQTPGEFLGKVHEGYLQKRERLESPRFVVRGPGGHVVDRVYGMGEDPPRPAPVVRPVYVPPPGAQTQVF